MNPREHLRLRSGKALESLASGLGTFHASTCSAIARRTTVHVIDGNRRIACRPQCPGSTAYTTPDFCDSSRISKPPPPSDCKTGGAPKSKSSPCGSGQLSFFSATYPRFHTSFGVNCRDHNLLPESMSKAITESDESVGGPELGCANAISE